MHLKGDWVHKLLINRADSHSGGQNRTPLGGAIWRGGSVRYSSAYCDRNKCTRGVGQHAAAPSCAEWSLVRSLFPTHSEVLTACQSILFTVQLLASDRILQQLSSMLRSAITKSNASANRWRTKSQLLDAWYILHSFSRGRQFSGQ